MLIAARNAILAGGAALPYDAEVEYLESTGTQRIDTGVLATLAYGCKIDLEDVATASYNCFIRNNTSNDFCIGSNNSNPLSSYLRLRSALTWANGIGAKKSFEIKNGVIKANGSQVGTYDASMPLAANANVIGLFASLGGGTPAKCKIFSCEIYESNSVLVRDFIPVRVGSGGSAVGYMYDRVSGQLFGNAGTGAFVIGPDASAVNGGGYKRQCVRRSHRRSWRPSARFCSPRLWKEVA